MLNTSVCREGFMIGQMIYMSLKLQWLLMVAWIVCASMMVSTDVLEYYKFEKTYVLLFVICFVAYKCLNVLCSCISITLNRLFLSFYCKLIFCTKCSTVTLSYWLCCKTTCRFFLCLLCLSSGRKRHVAFDFA